MEMKLLIEFSNTMWAVTVNCNLILPILRITWICHHCSLFTICFHTLLCYTAIAVALLMNFQSYMANIASTLFPFKTPIKLLQKVTYIYRCQFLILLHMFGQLLCILTYRYVSWFCIQIRNVTRKVSIYTIRLSTVY